METETECDHASSPKVLVRISPCRRVLLERSCEVHLEMKIRMRVQSVVERPLFDWACE